MVLDDAVVHDGQVARHMRVGVALGRGTVRGPARMGDAGGAADVLRIGQRRELGHAARRADSLHGAAIDHGDAGRVVASILQAPQPFDEDRDDVAP
jgi:hypothetical protein